MSRVVSWFDRFSLVVLLCCTATLAACADLAAPTLAPRPARLAAQCAPGEMCAMFGSTCAGLSDSRCECDPFGTCCASGTTCTITLPFDPPGPPDSASTPKVRILAARGPNAEGSFTTLVAERTLGLSASATPGHLAPSVTWTVGDDPGDAAPATPPVGPLPNGPAASVDVPRQGTARWRAPHGAPLSARALAFRIVAALPAGGARARDSVTVRQREVDVLRQEYVDFGIPVPNAGDVRTPAQVAGLTRFTWSQLNQGDYGPAVLTSVLLQKLEAVATAAGSSLSLSSVFRNPAHHRFHVNVSGGFATALLSQHQYGTAVDIRTFKVRATWARLRDYAKSAGACAEPLSISTTDHVHADWRPSAPRCPPGW